MIGLLANRRSRMRSQSPEYFAELDAKFTEQGWMSLFSNLMLWDHSSTAAQKLAYTELGGIQSFR